MRRSKALILVLAVVLIAALVATVGCGSDEEAKEELRVALDKVEQNIANLTKTFTSGGTVPEVKAAKNAFAADWQAVITAAEKVEGADVAAAKAAWEKLDAAISALPDDANLATAGASLLPAVQELQQVELDLRNLVGPSEQK